MDHENAKYGSTPVDLEDRTAFVDGFSAGTKAELDQAEIDGLYATYLEYLLAVEQGVIGAQHLTDWRMLADLHRGPLSRIRQWADQIRTTELTIGVDPTYV